MHRWLLFFDTFSFTQRPLRRNQYRGDDKRRVSRKHLRLVTLSGKPTFQQVSFSQFENSATTAQTVDLNISCSWPATGISLKFSIAAVSSTSLMKTGLSGVGLALSWKNATGTDLRRLN